MRFPFSNFLPFNEPMPYQGMLFQNVETFYQAMKTKDVEERRRISNMTASESKKAGRKLKIREDWESIKLDVMRYALRWKFKPATAWREALLATGNEKIAEYNTHHDNEWGVCMCATVKDPYYGNRQCKNGKNKLGILLMELREEIRKELS